LGYRRELASIRPTRIRGHREFHDTPISNEHLPRWPSGGPQLIPRWRGKNGYEWATGTNPTNSGSLALLGIGTTNSDAVVSFTRNTNATDVIIELQRSLNLVSNGWSSIATNTAGSWTPLGIVTETEAGNPVDVEINDSQTNQPAAYYRLRVE